MRGDGAAAVTGLLQSAVHDQEQVAVRLIRPAPRPDSPRVLLMHGLASSGSVWQGFAEDGAPGFALWAAELPWRAEGSASWAWRADAGSWAAQALAAVPGGADIIIAHSFAATALLSRLALAGAQGTTARGIVLVSPFYRSRAENFDWAAISYYLNDFHQILAEGIRVRSGGRLDPDVQHHMALRVQDRIGPYGWIRFFETYLSTPHLRLDHIAVPCLIIGGEDDFAAFPADAGALAAALPRAQAYILPGCGHFPMTTQAEAFGALVNDFLGTITENWSDKR
jgi:pimeloyl-ACP methyl ester carboxylesterase